MCIPLPLHRPPPTWHLNLHIERHVNPLRHLSLGHSATWTVSNRICSGLVSLTTQRCKPHTHLATCDTTNKIRKSRGYLHHPSSQQAMPMTTIDYRLHQRLQAFFAYEKLKSVLQVLSSRTHIHIHMHMKLHDKLPKEVKSLI